MTSHRMILAGCLAAGLVGRIGVLQASIAGPYTPDANTLHLWHIDEDTLDVNDSVVSSPISLTSLGDANGSSLGNTSLAGFGKAFGGVDIVNTGLFALEPANGGGDDTSTATFWNQTTGAFTYEAIVQIGFDPSTLPDDTYFMIMSMDNEGSGAPRPFQFPFRKVEAGDFRLEFENISGGGGDGSTLFAQLPEEPIENAWYHVAIAYNGDPGDTANTTFYWTQMLESATQAQAIGTVQQTADLGGSAGDFVIGAEARQNSSGSNPNGNQWPGLIDEVRISDIARSADDMQFIPEPSSLAAAWSALVALAWRRRRTA